MNQIETPNLQTYKESLIVANHVPARYICPGCQKRYGEPEEHGFMDIQRCEKCVRKKDLN